MFDISSKYRKNAHFNVTHRRRQNFYALPTSDWQMLAAPPFSFLKTLDDVDDAIDANAIIASRILAVGLKSFALEMDPKNPVMDWRDTATSSDLDKVRTTIRQFYRDWSIEGLPERQICYEPVIADITRAFAHSEDKGRIKVLVPGAGLGRLMFEFCKRGFSVEGNEISYHQLLASHWILNHTSHSQMYTLYPFVFDFSNVFKREDQLKSIKVPDIHPGIELDHASQDQQLHAFDRMSMTAADFVLLYNEEGYRDSFDAIVTVFFLDTAPNVIRYIQAIHHCLKKGGIWSNLGPLLWHFADRGPLDSGQDAQQGGGRRRVGIDEPGGVELTGEEVVKLVEQSGFILESHEINHDGTGYIQNPYSMLQNTYRTLHWIARKKS